LRLRTYMTASDLFRLRHQDNCQTAARFRREDLVPERELHTRKWFDYRFMSPKEATNVFRAEYQKVYRRKYASNIDTEKSLNKYGVRAGIPETHKAEFTSFWRVRQSADLLGMPYDVFLEAAFEDLLRGRFQRIPYINQLMGKYQARIAVAATDRWEEQCQSRLMYSLLPHYKQESFHGLAAQIAHQDWVLAQLKSRSDSTIGRACFTLRILPEERVRLQFGDERLENARAHAAGEVPEVLESLGPRQLLPSCVMLPGARDISSPECSSCKVATFCTRAEASVLGSVITVTGVADPRAERQRKLGRERTRKSRRKAKLAAEAKSDIGEKTT
jgi:hypothetical protein